MSDDVELNVGVFDSISLEILLPCVGIFFFNILCQQSGRFANVSAPVISKLKTGKVIIAIGDFI